MSTSAQVNDPLSVYMKEIGVVPLLTNEEEKEWALAMLKLMISAKQRLAEANIYVRLFLAKRYVGRGICFTLTIQEGKIWVMKAVDKFDTIKGSSSFQLMQLGVRQAISLVL